MAITNRYTGDSQVRIATATNVTRMHMRTVNNDTAASDRVFEVQAGSSIDFFWRRVNEFFGLPPNKVTIEVRDDNTGTVIRTYQTNAAEPANGATFTFWGTNDGTSTGTARAGVVRLYWRTIRDNGVATDNWDADSDGTVTVSPAGSTVTIHGGCLRSNGLADLSVNAYTGAATKFRYGETITLTASITQRYTNQTSTCRLDFTNSSDAQLIAGTATAATGTTFTHDEPADNSFSASLAIYGARFLPTGNAAFVPTSGAILWTKWIASGSAVQDGNNVKRSNFYSVDPRINVSLEAERDNTRTDGGNTTQYIISADQLFVWARARNIDNEDIAGITFTQQLLDSSETVLIQNTVKTTGANGWTPDPGVDFTSQVLAPAGNRTQRAFPNAPAGAVGLGTADQTLGFSSAFTANRAPAIGLPEFGIAPGSDQRLTFEYRQSDGTRLSLDSTPSIRIYHLDSLGGEVVDLPLTVMTQFAGQNAWFKDYNASGSENFLVEVRFVKDGGNLEAVTSWVYGGATAGSGTIIVTGGGAGYPVKEKRRPRMRELPTRSTESKRLDEAARTLQLQRRKLVMAILLRDL